MRKNQQTPSRVRDPHRALAIRVAIAALSNLEDALTPAAFRSYSTLSDCDAPNQNFSFADSLPATR